MTETSQHLSHISQAQSKSQAIPFITFEQTTKKFIISDEAYNIISNPIYTKIGMISLVGKYRTGKSFLWNRVLLKNKNQTKGFDVGPTIKPCTKGIWLWSSPWMITNTHSDDPFPAFLIDTEGLGAYDEEINHDSKIFWIAIWISSLFIYNSFGTIDENAINNLSWILSLSKSLKLRNTTGLSTNNTNEEEEMANYFPSWLWLLRDFALKLEDSEGNVITAKQYLDNALVWQKGSTEKIEEKNNVRKLVKTFFPERDCFPMVRPVENENDLQNWESWPDEWIRSEFINQAEVLRNKVLKKTKPKNFNGKVLSGSMLLEWVQSVINSINEGAIPVIENSWKYVMSNECLKGVNAMVAEYKNKIMEYQSENIEHSNYFSELEQYNTEWINELVNTFIINNKDRFDDITEYVSKLKLNLNQAFKKLNEDNVSLLKDKYENEINKELRELVSDKSRIEAMNYLTFFSELIQIKYKVDGWIPTFPRKSQIAFDTIIATVKKYIENVFIKDKNESAKVIQTLQNENTLLNDKNTRLLEEYEKDKKDYKDSYNKWNENWIELKLKEKSNEEKIKNFENAKKAQKESYDRELLNITKQCDAKLEKEVMNGNKIRNELKTKEEELLVFKLNTEKISALNVQKITFLEKEIEQWKERFAILNKEWAVCKSEIINWTSENDKLREEVKNAQREADTNRTSGSNSLGEINQKNSGNNNFLNTNILNNWLKEQTELKHLLQKLSVTTASLVENNRELTSSNQTLVLTLSSFDELFNNNNIGNVGNTNKNNIVSTVTPSSTPENSIIKVAGSPSGTAASNNKIDIKIWSTILSKDETGKTYLEYLCEISTKNQNWKLQKKFHQFSLLNKTLKNLFKSLVQYPETGSLFTNINDMVGNSFHENKIQQWDKYIKELCLIDNVVQSVPFRTFFELDEYHDIKPSTPKTGNTNYKKISKSNSISVIEDTYNDTVNFEEINSMTNPGFATNSFATTTNPNNKKPGSCKIIPKKITVEKRIGNKSPTPTKKITVWKNTNK